MKKNRRRPILELPHPEGDGLLVLRVPENDPQNKLGSKVACVSLADSQPLTPKQTLAKIRFLIKAEMLKVTDSERDKYTPLEIEEYARRKVVREELENLNRKVVMMNQSITAIKKVFGKESGSRRTKPRNWEERALALMEKERWGVVAISRFKVWQALKGLTMTVAETRPVAEGQRWWHREVIKGKTVNCYPVLVTPSAVRSSVARTTLITPATVDVRIRELEKRQVLKRMGKLGQNDPLIYMMGHFQPVYGKALWTVNADNWWKLFRKK